MSFQQGLSGLNAASKNLDVIGHNIANVNTAGYSKQIITQSALVVEGVGSGVRLDDIVRDAVLAFLEGSKVVMEKLTTPAE